jgi:hypothetical protein
LPHDRLDSERISRMLDDANEQARQTDKNQLVVAEDR